MGVVGVAYTNPDNDPNIPTTLFDIDANRDLLVVQNPPNSGTLVPINPLGIDAGSIGGFNIGLNFGIREFYGLTAIQISNGSSCLFSVDLAAGRTSGLGRIGNSTPIRGLVINLRSSDRGIE